MFDCYRVLARIVREVAEEKKDGGNRESLRCLMMVIMGARNTSAVWIKALWSQRPETSEEKEVELWLVEDEHDDRWHATSSFAAPPPISLFCKDDKDHLHRVVNTSGKDTATSKARKLHWSRIHFTKARLTLSSCICCRPILTMIPRYICNPLCWLPVVEFLCSINGVFKVLLLCRSAIQSKQNPQAHRL